MKYQRTAYLAEIKADSDDGTFTGMASTFGNKDLVNDIIEPGAFAKSIKRRGVGRIKLLAFHNPDEPIGRFTEIEENSKGLAVTGELALKVQKAQEVHELMKIGALDSLSIGFRADPSKQQFDDARNVRILKEIDLLEVSVVTFPANERARIRTVKEMLGDNELPSVRQFEECLRDVGFGERLAKAIIADGYKAVLAERDVLDTASLSAADRIAKALQSVLTPNPQ